MKINNILVVYTSSKSNNGELTVRVIKNTLNKYEIKHKFVHRDKLNKKLFQNKDLIIVAGGDGTFIRASHFILDKTPILGVNSNPKYKEGFFMASTKKDFNVKFRKVLISFPHE